MEHTGLRTVAALVTQVAVAMEGLSREESGAASSAVTEMKRILYGDSVTPPRQDEALELATEVLSVRASILAPATIRPARRSSRRSFWPP